MTPAATAKKKNLRQILVFSLRGEEMALPIESVREVLMMQLIHPLVQAPDFIEGVIHLRKFVLAVVSLRKRLGFTPCEDVSRERIIICKVNTMIIGLMVDNVSQVLTVPERDIQPAPDILSLQRSGHYVSGLARVGERVITLLDIERVITREELTRLSEVTA